MGQNLQEIIKNSSFSVIDGIYIYAKVASMPKTGEHFMISKDSEEITVVTEYTNLKQLDLIERNKDDYALIALNVSIPFYSVGFLATVSTAIANARINILIVSTYSKDYILVKHDKLDVVKETLVKLGFSEE